MPAYPVNHSKACNACGLWKSCKSPFMESSGSDNPRILVIGEAPGEDEDTDGIPFVGKSGDFLRTALGDVFDIDEIRFTNVVRCRPPNNKISKEAITYCKDLAIRDIETYNPEFVFLMGNSPLSGILGQVGISNWNGVLVKKDGRKYLPLFHPAYILRDMSNMDSWLEAMMSIEDEEADDSYKRVIVKTMSEFRKMHKQLSSCDRISFDLETNTLDAYSGKKVIISASFAGDGIAYSFPLHHQESWWAAGEKAEIEDTICNLLVMHSKNIIGHNIKFDQMMTNAQLDHTFIGGWFEAGGDSMLISHMLDSRRGIHGLKRLAGVHLGMYNYDAELDAYKQMHKEADPERGGNYGNIPLEILLPYGALDAEACFKLHDILYDKLSDKQKILYHQLIMPASDALCKMQCNGFMIDKYIAWRYNIIYAMALEDAKDDILADKVVKKYVRDRQKQLDVSIQGTRRRRVEFEFNPNSHDQLRDLYFDYYDIPILARSKKTGNPSTSAKLYKNMHDKYPILKLVRIHGLFAKMLSTYLGPAVNGRWTSKDGKARTSFNLHGTRTGRTSSGSKEDKLNFQNIPVPEKEPGTLLAWLPIKNIFTHSYQRTNGNGHVKHEGYLVSVDYSGMELRCFASLSHCMNMIRIMELKKDVHSCVAIMSMTGKLPDEITFEEIKVLPKPVRYVYKWTNWTLLYGGDEHTLHRMYDVPLDKAKETVRLYYSIFPEVLEYKDQCIAFAEANGYIESPYGRREMLPYIDSSDNKMRAKSQREAVNMPVQSGAGDTLLASLVMVQAEMEKANLKSKLVNEVHDSIVGDCPANEVKAFGTLAKNVMENVKTYGKTYMPDIDFSWIIAPLVADVEVGTHYGTEVDYEKWLETQRP